MNQLSTLVVVLTIGLLAGCSHQPSVPAVTELPQRTERPLVDSPDYLHWQRFPLETKVVHKKVATNGKHEVTVTTRLVLKEKTPERVVVEQQVTVDHPATEALPSSKLENPPQKLEYAAKFRLPEGIEIEKFSLPSIKAERIGTEPIEILGQQYEAEVFRWVDQSERGPTTNRLWRVEAVPGRLLKHENSMEGSPDSSIETLIELHIPDSTAS